MADSTVVVNGYSREALQQIEAAFRAAGGGTAGGAGGSSNPDGTDDNTDAVEDNTQSVGTLTKAQRNLSTAFTHMKNLVGGRGLNMLLGEFKSGLAGGVEAMGNQGDTISTVEDYLGRTIASFAKLGISLEEFNNFNTATRAAVINLGGMDAWAGKLASQQEEYYARTGSNIEAVKHQTEMMNLLIHSGARAEDLYDRFGNQLKSTNDELLKMGVTYQESREHLQGMMKNESVRQRLMSTTDANQRRSIMLEVQERFKNLKMLGMTTEQAKSASEALEALSGKGPLDRIRESAKMQAGLSAMGIENAEEVARIYRLGDRANEQQREVMRKALGRLQEIQAEARTDTMGRELTIDAISTRTGLNNLEKVFSEKLSKGAAIEQEQLNAIRRIGEDSPTFVKMTKGIDTINNFLEKSWIMESHTMAKDLVKGGIAMAAAAPTIAATAGAIGLAADGFKAFETGESRTWNTISKTFPEASENFSDGVGTFVDGVLAFAGNKSAKDRLKLHEVVNATESQRRDAAEEAKGMREEIIELSKRMGNVTDQMMQAQRDQKGWQEKQHRETIDALTEQIVVLSESASHQEKIAGNTKSAKTLKGQDAT